MRITTLSGTVENGQIRLADNVRLPEKATVYVIVPDLQSPDTPYVASPRLRYPEQAAEFHKEVVEEDLDAGV